ncbi:hypothetical protein RJI07_00815 [Mycoplasmatota bacterium WC30]
MPQNLDFALYFNLSFFGILGLGILFGFLKGLKKSMWGFFVTVIFYAFFFLTITQVVNVLWTLNLPFLGSTLGGFMPSLSGVSSLQDALPILLEELLPAELQTTLTNEHFLELVSSIALFAVKIIYAIIYFTVIQILYRLIFWIIRIIIFPNKKKTEKYKSKNRGIGAIFGLMSGGLSLYVTLIIFGGLISISESLLSAMPEPVVSEMAQIEYSSGFDIPTESIIPLVEISDFVGGQTVDEAFDLLTDMVNGYNGSVVVTAQNQLTMTSEYTGEEMPLNLYLFDSVLSMDYQEEQIAIREELGIYAQVASNVLNSDFLESMDVADLTGDEIRGVFTDLSESNLFTSILPLAVEVGADFFDTEIDIPTEDLYEISWETEIMQLGEIAATVLDIVNAAGILNDEMDLNTVTLDGDEIETLFVELGQSDLITLAAYVAIAPVLEMAGDQISAIITVPEDIVWEDEFAAIGAVAGEILNTDLTIGAFSDVDVMTLLSSLAEVDFTVLLESQIVTNAMINILSGDAGIDISFITVPDDIIWLDAMVDGVLVNGELRNILLAVNALAGDLEDFDLETIDINFIANLDPDNINTLFESKILIATITQYITTDLDLGDQFTIIMPDSIFDEDGYLLKSELQNIVSAVHMAVTELVCPVGDTDCEELGFDVAGMLSLSGDNIDILLESDMLSATVGNLILEMGGDVLTVPGSALTTIQVDEVDTDVVSRIEIKSAFLAITALGIDDIDNIEVDASILTNLALADDPTILDPDKADLLFASSVINATLSAFLIDFSEEDGALVVVPYLAEDDLTVIRVIDPIDSTEYISEAELTNILEAVLILDIQDFEAIDTIDLNVIIDNVGVLLDSAILHATVTKQLLDLTDVIKVPTSTVVTTGPAGNEADFIQRSELIATFDALKTLGITDINNVAIDITILNNLAVDGESTVLDTDKSDVLFGSVIINATLSKFLIDFTTGDAAMVVVPYIAEDDSVIRVVEDDGTEIISETELTNILKAVLILDIQDFEAIDTLDLDVIISNVTVLLDSSILHATVSKQLLDLTEVIKVPASTIVTKGPVGDEVDFIQQTELEATFDALDVLGITDINNVAIDITILNNLAEEGDPTVLDTDKSDILFGSVIINATLSKFLIDFTEGDEAIIVVPYQAEDTTVIRTVETDGTNIISETELTNILTAILVLDIDDFNAVDTLDLDVIINNVSVLLDSAILHATISKQLFDLGSEVITVPYRSETNSFVRLTVGGVGEETEYIAKTELEATFDALELLEITDVNSFSGDIDFGTILGTPGNVDILLTSSIIHATISDQVINLSDGGGESLLAVPFKDETEADIRLTVGGVGEETEYIIKTEIKAVFDALDLLGITDVNEFTGSIDFGSILSDPDNVDTLLDSAVIHATISDQVINLTDDGGDSILVVPFREENNSTLVRKTVGGIEEETEYIVKTEIKAIFDALDVLGIADVETFDGSVDLGLLSDPVTVNTVLLSSVIQATISKQLIDLDDGVTIIVPYYQEDNLTPVRVLTGLLGDETEYVVKTELEAIFDALDVLGITDVESFGGNEDLDLSLLAEGNNADIVLGSSMVQAIISRQVIDLDDITEAVIVPYIADDNITEIRIDADAGAVVTNYVNRIELKELVLSLDVLNMTDVNDFGGSINLDLLTEDATINQVLSSSILQATISEQIINLGADETLVVPFVTEDNLTDIRVSTGPVGFETEYVVVIEIKAIINALDVLGIADVEAFSGTVNLSLLSDTETKNTVLSSSVIQATISKQLLDLDDTDGAIIVPYYQEDTTTAVRVEVGPVGFETVYIAKVELSDMFTALDVLGLSDVGDFGNDDIDFSIFATGNNAEVIIESVIIQATVSKQILDLDLDGTIEVPYMADDGISAIRVTVGPVGNLDELVVAAELEATIIALDILNVTDPSAYNGAVDLSLFYEVDSRNTLLASSTMQATISEQIIGLGAAITVPILEDDDVTDVRKTVGVIGFETEYIMKTEIHALFEALEILGMDEIDDFSGTITLDTFLPSKTTEYDGNQNILLDSASIQATISKQILDLQTSGFVVIPTTDVDDIAIQILVSGTDFIYVDEIKLLINAMDLLGVTDITNFDGNLGLTPLLASQDIAFDANQDTMLYSAIMHATITDQVTALDGGAIVLPTTDVLGAAVQLTVSTNEFITKLEIKSLINAMDLLGFNGNLDGFGGEVNLTTLYNDTNQNTLLTSAIMHATITDQISGLDGGAIVLPSTDVLDNPVQLSVATNQFITKLEIKSLLNALDVLGIGGDLTDFGGEVNLNTLYSDSNQNTLLTSAIMHATITDQINGLDGGSIVLPSTDVLDDPIQLTVSLNEFITKLEIKSLLNALDVLGIGGNLAAFDGNIGLTALFASTDVDFDENQDTILTSAIMHATMTDQIAGLTTGGNIVLPDTDVLGTAIETTVSTNYFITKLEIKSLINAMDVIGFSGNLGGFGGTISLAALSGETNQTILLTSAIMHATLSDKLFNDTGGNLYIPDVDINLATTVRVNQSGTVFIEKNETKALLTALNEMGLTDYAAMTVTPAIIFAADFDVMLASATMQSTISHNILGGALDDSAAAGSSKLIVPNALREIIAIATVADEWIEKVELKALLNSLSTLGITDFSGTVGGDTITGMNDSQLNTMLGSGSMQVTIDNMLKGNSNINTKIPDKAQEDVYGMTDITTKAEIIAFVKATQQIGAGDITNVTFSAGLIAALSPAQRDIALDSMIVRNMLTDELEATMLADDPLDLYWPANSDYEDSLPATFLTEAGINLVLTHYGLI